MDNIIDKLAYIAEQAAIKAGELLREGFSKEIITKTKTSIHDLVTPYDIQVEQFVISFIKQEFPDHNFLAEESGLSSLTPNQITWIIDPIDGTTNFSRKIPLFSISIAAVFNDEVIMGVIFSPITEELFVAKKNQGAYLNGQKIKCSSTITVPEGVFGIGFPYEEGNYSTENLNLYFKLLNQGTPIRNLGSGALSLAYVAAGKIDGFWIPSLYIWDLAAGLILVQEAGGIVTHQNGESFKEIVSHKPFDILATNKNLHDKILLEMNNKP